MALPLNRQDCPPKPGPSDEIFRVKAGSEFTGQICSETIWGCWTHWDGYRTRECTARFITEETGEHEGETESIRDQGIRLLDHATAGTQCRGHAARHPLRWKGYLHVYSQGHRKYGFLECTPMAAEEILRQQPTDKNLRGLLLRMYRIGQSDKSRIRVELTKGVLDVASLAKGKDPEQTLRALWGWVTVR